jgi:hypothetical protein
MLSYLAQQCLEAKFEEITITKYDELYTTYQMKIYSPCLTVVEEIVIFDPNLNAVIILNDDYNYDFLFIDDYRTTDRAHAVLRELGVKI